MAHALPDLYDRHCEEIALDEVELVLQEARAGDSLLASHRLEILQDVPVSSVSSEILKLAEDLITEVPIPLKAAGDAAHIAIATVYGCEYLLTWNCRHIANAELYRACGRSWDDTGSICRACARRKN